MRSSAQPCPCPTADVPESPPLNRAERRALSCGRSAPAAVAAWLLQIGLPLALALSLLRTFATQQRAAEKFGVHQRTVRNWISRGLITGYRLPGGRAVRVDLDEIERMLTLVPATVVRHKVGRKPFGPEATIVSIHADAVAVDGLAQR